MTEWQFTAAIANANHRSLQRLIRAIALSKGQFALILVRCNYGQLRKQVIENLRTLTKDIYLREIELSPSTTANLHNTIVSELYLDVPAVATDTLPSAIMVFGLESVTSIEDLLTGLNQARDIYADTLPFPLVLWLKDDVATLLSRLAPDFKSWAATTIKFEMAKEDLIGLIRHQTESLFAKVMETGVDIYGSNSILDLRSSYLRDEIESAREDLLRLYNVQLDSELEASLEFVLGRSSYINDQVEEALTHYQRSLALSRDDFELLHTESANQDNCDGLNAFGITVAGEQYNSGQSHLLPKSWGVPLLTRAIVLFHLGLCYRRMADLRPSLNRSYWQEALFWFKQCLELLESAQYFVGIAKFILPACEMLQRLELWPELQTLAQKSLLLHETYGTKAQSAQDYGFLATVATAQSNWLQAYELAATARSIAEIAPDVSRQQESWYLLLQGRSQRHLGEWEEAINNLEWAKVVCELQYEPSLYLEIVEELRSLYFFERHDYSEAFNLKQEKIQIEHQYGFRAFIGASQLQPQRYKINPGHTQRTGTQQAAYVPESAAQEIAASGRQKDISNLIERISRADCKLTVIHGPSGVGKSSILKAGLVPALHEKVIGSRIAIPIVLSVYSDWVTVLGRSFNQVLAQTDLSISINFTTAILLQKLRELTERNHAAILIFDQLEEFFFVVKDQSQRIEFYKFISECLNIPYVKVIFSLREDYLHYLLEFERLCNESSRNTYDLGIINKNILDKDIRYYLGKFSLHDAIGVIDVLTQRSHYELSNELINQLVQDLAGEVEEVHPIELQIVGAQLQSEKITTLEEYQDSGGSEKLVERWLSEVIKDCGRENEQITWKLLFELTDEKGTRPLRTKIELAVALTKNNEPGFNFESVWELILHILVGSGLVLRVRESECDRYQLIHDYLVEPIRQKNNYGIVAELEKVRFQKTRAEVAQKLSQEQLNFALQRRLREARMAGAILAMMTATIGGLWWQADLQKRSAIRETRRAERSETNQRISAITAASEALFASNKEFDALMESLRAWRKLEQAPEVQPETKMRVVTALQQAVYGVKESNRLEGHGDIVWGVVYSPDGKLLASGSNDKTIKIWQPNGALVQTINAHNDAITSLSFSGDGQRLATSSLDKSVRVWQRKPNSLEFEQQPKYILDGHADGVLSVNYSPDGQILASTSKDKTIKLWDSNGNLVKILRGHDGWVHYVSFSPDGQLIASSSEDKTIKIWRRDGTLLTTLTGSSEGVTFVTFSPDSQTLASGTKDNIIKLWKRERKASSLGALPADGNNYNFVPTRTLTGHTNAIWSLTFSPNGQQLASGSEDNTINIWDVSDGSLLKTLKGHNDAVASVAFSPDGKTLASGSYDKSIKFWSLEPPALPILEGHSDRVLNVAWSPEGKMLASASKDKTIKLWERSSTNGTSQTRLYKTLVGHTEKVSSVSFDPKGEILASGSYDNTIKLWRRDGSLLKTLIGHTDSVMSVSFSPDGELLASASKDKTIKLWNRQGELLKTLEGHQGWVNNLSFSPDGKIIASASDDQTVRLWQRDGTFIKTLTSHDSWVLGVSFSPTDRVLASAGWDNTIKLWSWDGKLIKTLLKGYSDSVNAVNFSPNGEILAAANWDSTVKLWSRDGKLLKTLNGHRAPVLSATFSPDGQTLASASADNTIILWNLDLNDLLKHGCSWVNDYLKHNRNVDGRDRNLCEGVGSRE
jgi:WD40 repeat protein/tetratricopeptide (TPR) repeat protein